MTIRIKKLSTWLVLQLNRGHAHPCSSLVTSPYFLWFHLPHLWPTSLNFLSLPNHYFLSINASTAQHHYSQIPAQSLKPIPYTHFSGTASELGLIKSYGCSVSSSETQVKIYQSTQPHTEIINHHGSDSSHSRKPIDLPLPALMLQLDHQRWHYSAVDVDLPSVSSSLKSTVYVSCVKTRGNGGHNNVAFRTNCRFSIFMFRWV